MTISHKMSEAINRQIVAELYSSYLYMSMSAWAKANNYTGMSNWLLIQAEEERIHGLKLFNFLLERGANVQLDTINAPPISWDSPRDVFENVREHEQHVTSLIYDLVDIAVQERDHAARQFLDWFVAEQVEEEAAAEDVLRHLQLIGDTSGNVFLLDRELAARVLDPTLAALRPGG